MSAEIFTDLIHSATLVLICLTVNRLLRRIEQLERRREL